jgi:4-methylaminobutanoate oxidase (formaldehyde-forming)
MAWLRAHVADDDGPVPIRDVSADLATIGLWGPRARDILAATGADVTDEAIPLRRAREVQVGPAPVLASRISYAGELGWELTTDAGWAVAAWDTLRAAGADVGLEPFGYRALDALRMEKGYRYFGTDLTMLDTPFEAGLGAFVRLDRRFVRRDALAATRPNPPESRRLGQSSDGADCAVFGGGGPPRGGHRPAAKRRVRLVNGRPVRLGRPSQAALGLTCSTAVSAP